MHPLITLKATVLSVSTLSFKFLSLLLHSDTPLTQMSDSNAHRTCLIDCLSLCKPSLIPVLFLCLLVSSPVSSLVSVVCCLCQWMNHCPLFSKWITFEISLFSYVPCILWDSLSFLFPTVFRIERGRREEADMNDEWSFPSPEVTSVESSLTPPSSHLTLLLVLPIFTSNPYPENLSLSYISPHLKQQVLEVIRT